LTTTRQIETRVKRQVVLEDGKVVGDSGPIVTTNTTEDTETQEHKQTEVSSIADIDHLGPYAASWEEDKLCGLMHANWFSQQ
jgi:bifunctional N-acetylglucosamine-1-phosphate-uridyltransferase/glucosamine-1-phosphate-acetyltransferase GlmU-like protein